MSTRATSHVFSIEDAKKYGVEEAVLLANIKYWTDYNEANGLNFHDGRYWTFNSKRAFADLFPYWTERQVRRILENLLEKGAIISGRYNNSSYDRTLWYAINEESTGPNGPTEQTEESKTLDQTGQPIPYINADSNPNEKQYPSLSSTGKKKKVFAEDSVEYKIAYGLYLKIKNINTEMKEPNFNKWASDVDLIIRVDKKTPQELCDKIRDVMSDDFWSKVILSPGKLRVKWNEGKLANLKSTSEDDEDYE